MYLRSWILKSPGVTKVLAIKIIAPKGKNTCEDRNTCIGEDPSRNRNNSLAHCREEIKHGNDY